MRYSMLVYLTNMGKTLLEAARYLRTAEDRGLQKELLENGRQMVGQIRAELKRHSGDLRTPQPLELLRDIGRLWDKSGTGSELEEKLETFVRRLPEEVSYRVRAVFFAELGEKWDAMESVYEFMRDDPRFDPVVVRTPVFRVVNQGGTQKSETIYKDFLTPIGIPSLGYNEYSLEADCPDLAFISQPYESCTLRAFWPETIAKVTRLVYLPYFAPFSVYESARTALCEMPVYRYAWKTIGSSQRHYEYYRKYAINGGGNMLVTGVPKWDATVRLRTSPVGIPEEWKKAVEGKTVFLWNTFYDFSGSSLPYFDSIYQWFQEHPECALIWRAHPMTDTVTKLYYPPQYYDQLQKCISLVEAAPNMVCDRNASYEASFCCTTAQISDLSSLMFQYLLLDKPVLYIKTSGRGKVEKDFFIDSIWMERADNAEEIQRFLNRICAGTDKNADLRQLVRQRDIPLADGQCGVRVCNVLWDLLHKEDHIAND